MSICWLRRTSSWVMNAAPNSDLQVLGEPSRSLFMIDVRKCFGTSPLVLARLNLAPPLSSVSPSSEQSHTPMGVTSSVTCQAQSQSAEAPRGNEHGLILQPNFFLISWTVNPTKWLRHSNRKKSVLLA